MALCMPSWLNQIEIYFSKGREEAVKKLEITKICSRKCLHINGDFLRFAAFFNFFTASKKL